MEEPTALGPTRRQCAHPACTCSVDDDKVYCSDYCAKAGAEVVDDDDTLACGCGHAECDAP